MRPSGNSSASWFFNGSSLLRKRPTFLDSIFHNYFSGGLRFHSALQFIQARTAPRVTETLFYARFSLSSLR
jgi:hypothetical protein